MCSVEADDLDVAAVDEQDDPPAAVGAPDRDVVQASLVAQGDGPLLVEFVVADAVAGGVDAGAGGVGLFAGGEGGGRSAAADGPVRAGLVVVGGEAVELGLELFFGVGGVLLGEVFLQGLVEAFDLAAGLRVVGPGVLGADAQAEQLDLQRAGGAVLVLRTVAARFDVSAETVSAARACTNASERLSAIAHPQGFACLIMAAAGFSVNS